MAAAQSSLQIEPPPSSRGVVRALSNAFHAVRNANAEVIDRFQDVTTQRQHADEDRQRIQADHAELSGLRGEVEAKLVDLAEATEKVEQDAQAVDAKQEEAARDVKRLARLDEELGSREEVIAQRQRDMEESVRCLSEKEVAVARAGQKYETGLGEVASQREQVQRESDSVNERQSRLADQQSHLGDRSDQLDLYAKELDGSRSALETMQVQLLRDQSEIASHREALLTQIARQPDRVGGAIQSTHVPVKRSDDNGSASRSVSIPKAPKGTPKAGGGSSAEQFRKLRRDAKRKSIGL